MTPFDLAALRAREYADQCDADNDPVRAQWARAQAAKYELMQSPQVPGQWLLLQNLVPRRRLVGPLDIPCKSSYRSSL